jgi:hypothetical protein
MTFARRPVLVTANYCGVQIFLNTFGGGHGAFADLIRKLDLLRIACDKCGRETYYD